MLVGLFNVFNRLDLTFLILVLIPDILRVAALNNFVRGVSIPFADDGIRINSVAPGNIFFKGSVWDRKIKENPKKIKKMLADNVPLKRFGKPEEIADFVTYLSSSKSNFITGGIFVIDGGQLKS